jgi:hypothetical protein
MIPASIDGGHELEDQDGDDQDEIESEQEKGDANGPCHLDLRLPVFPSDVRERLELAA